MARTARSNSVIASLVAHFASAPIAEAEQGLEIIEAVVAHRKGSAGAKRGPKPAAAAAAPGTATGPQAVAPKPKRVRVRNRKKAKAGDAVATPGVAAADATAPAGDAPAAVETSAADQPLPDQAAGDQG